ncbi:NAD-dependent epimerase/dehydratase family protein [Thalassotalea euphylliae]|uniref:NAD(P)-dependent oxidoreductase n=1 Tax=Thalassotalea euphylliae TaxID=1655234 RepID=A0A3E0UCW4_9GAMM|nr:NAD(P)-dependent oxidoreductase [Thalassotalea euphylliae]REL34838.1 NAD(P)-dependent oxidoreductase [Thalassotalea euphylliae]
MLENKRVLVAGGAGFLGSNLVEKLVDEGFDVSATLHNSPAQIESEHVKWLQCDLLNKADCLAACKDRDIVFVCAAYTAGAMVIEHSPLKLLTPNLIMNALLLEAAYESGVKKVVFVSSNTVYPVAGEAMSEEDVTGEYFHKYHIVASMKAFSEQICQMYAEKIAKPIDVTVIRPGNMYGPYDDFEWETSHVLPAFIRRVVERHNPISVWGDGKDIKDLVYVGDVVDGMIKAAKQCSGYNEYNIASGQGYCLRELLALLQEIDGYQEADIEYDATKPSMIPKRLININKAKAELGYEPKVSMREGLAKTLAWYRGSL